MNTHNKAFPARNTDADAGASGTEMQIAGSNLRTVMERELARRQMSVSGLARDARVQRGDIYRWWRGEQRPSRNSIARVAAALDVPTSMLSSVYGEVARDTAPDLPGALRDLATELRAAREERAAMYERMAEVEAVLRALVEPAMQDDVAPHAPRETTGSGRA